MLVSLRNFHGIELEDFACCVARAALWIAEKQADADTAKVTQRVYQELPLTDYEGIVNANALRIDWNDVVPASEVDYIIGNPPFIGYSNLNNEQKADRSELFGRLGGTLDYVACWYKKASAYMTGTAIKAAFVSTNSICQGQQVSALWRPLFSSGLHIDYAYQTFVWNSEAPDGAHVHVVIIGFSMGSAQEDKTIYGPNGTFKTAANINAYLMPGPDKFIDKRPKPFAQSEMSRGGGAGDWGYLTLRQTNGTSCYQLTRRSQSGFDPSQWAPSSSTESPDTAFGFPELRYPSSVGSQNLFKIDSTQFECAARILRAPERGDTQIAPGYLTS